MRARLALLASRTRVQLREVVLRDKPAEMIAASPKATVPVLLTTDGTVLDESLDIMLWALGRNDPDGWLTPQTGDKAEMASLIARMDGPFKAHLDRYKYANRHATHKDEVQKIAHESRVAAMAELEALDERLGKHRFLFGERLSLADAAIAPFVRQFAHTDMDWFVAQNRHHLQKWLATFLDGALFGMIMGKHDQWKTGMPGVLFPDGEATGKNGPATC